MHLFFFFFKQQTHCKDTSVENNSHNKPGDIRHLPLLLWCVTSKLTNTFLASMRKEVKNGVPEINNTFPLNSTMLN